MKTSNQEMNPLFGISPEDAIGMLVADHKRVAALFAQFKRLTAEARDEDKGAIVKKICEELTLHTQLEEELFYPAVRKATKDDDQMDEALVEHAGAKQLVAQLQEALPDDDLYDAKVTVLGEQIDHHVEEEEGSMFPKARHAGLDTLALGAAMAARRSELLGGAAKRDTPTALTVRDSGAADDASRVRSPRTVSKKKAAGQKSKKRR
jgi:hemerythrin superfamily protein